eukprot:tig00001428_g8718.t1
MLLLAAFFITQFGFWLRRPTLPVAGSVAATTIAASEEAAISETLAASSKEAEPLDWQSAKCPAAPDTPFFLGSRLKKREQDGLPHCDPGDTVTFVLPLTLNDFPRFKILDKSMKKFFDMSGVCEILMIVIDKEAEEVAEGLKGLWLTPHIRVLKENQLVPELKKWEVPNWIRQQILKLSMASQVRTKYYITFDSDIIAVQKCGLDTLFVGGKGKTNMEHKDRLGLTIPAWWEGSAKVLGVAIPESQPQRFGVTPAILSTTVTRSIGRHIEEKFGVCWRDHLVDRVWDSYTEYGIYFTYAAATGLFEKYHVENKHGVYKEFALCVWWPNMIDTWDMKR